MSPDPDDHAYYVWSKFLIASLAAACTVFFIFAFYRIIIHHCLSFRGPPRLAADSGEHPWDQLESRGRGLSDDELKSLPVVRWSEEIKGGDKESSDCAVCLGVFEKGDELRLLPNCSHFFHVHCVDAWLRSQSSCPLCRKRALLGDATEARSPVAAAASVETRTREEIHRETPADYSLLILAAMY